MKCILAVLLSSSGSGYNSPGMILGNIIGFALVGLVWFLIAKKKGNKMQMELAITVTSGAIIFRLFGVLYGLLIIGGYYLLKLVVNKTKKVN